MKIIKGDAFFNSLGLAPSVPFGSLWWITEEIWRQSLPRFYAANTSRDSHPGLSVSKDRLSHSLDPYFFLHGTSKRKNKHCMVVKGITTEHGAPHTTYFGHFNPVPVESALFSSGRVSRSSKPIVDNNEMQDLRELMTRRGWA